MERVRTLARAESKPPTPGVQGYGSERVLGYNAIVPPRVREALLSRNIENDDLLPTIGLPTLITHGDRDEIALPVAAEQHAADDLPGMPGRVLGTVSHVSSPF